MSAAAKTASVIAVDWRYITLGLKANNPTAASAAALESKIRRAAANRNRPAATKHAAGGIAPASPLRHSPSFRTKGSIRMCGSGSHTPPIWSYPGVLESTMRRAMLRCASASP
jgi:hypothetical protein